MGQVLLLLVVALTVAAVVFGVTVLVTGGDPGLGPTEPDGRSVPLPGNRPLHETDMAAVRFDTALRGYRMAQVDEALRRAAYDIGYKDELIGVLKAEVTALREGRTADADDLRRAREAALAPVAPVGATAKERADSDGTVDVQPVAVSVGPQAAGGTADAEPDGVVIEVDAARAPEPARRDATGEPADVPAPGTAPDPVAAPAERP